MRKKSKLARKILDFWMQYRLRKKRSCFSHQMEYEIGRLNPGLNVKQQIYEFYLGKITLCLVILGTGTVLIILYVWSASTNPVLWEEKYIERNPVGGIQKSVVLNAQVGELKVNEITIPVEEKRLGEAEAWTLLEEVALALPDKILGNNASLSHVNQPLSLINTWDTYPVTIFWDSSNYGVLQNDGSFGLEEIPREGMEVTLTATLSYETFSKELSFLVTLYPPDLSQEEDTKRQLLALVEQKQEVSRTEDYLELPDTLADTKVTWREPIAELLPALILLLMGTIIVVFVGKDSELHKEYEERNKRLLLEYPEFVSKLQLLICSGMSIRSALIRMGKDYEKSRRKGGRKQYVCEELLLAIRKMENGMSEAEALEFFGKRCQLFCYKKTVSLILQNLKRGSDGLRDALLSEVKAAFEERKQTARRMGEEAGTKLLLPMMLLMGIVLVIIIIPAYFSFGGI